MSGGERVLVIEDSESQRRLIGNRLQRLGYGVVAAGGGDEGLRLLREKRPDVVLLDVVMPRPDGWETLELIRKVSEVPVIMLTARTSEVDCVRGLRGGADDYVRKPFHELELAARIDAAVRRSAEARLDPLTTLPNHRAFHERLELLLSGSPTSARPVSLVLFDLDDFKAVNDRHGHAVGDQVLHDVSGSARRELRGQEELFRVGGEEFAVVVEGDSQAAVHATERIQAALRGGRKGSARTTISAGVASAPAHARKKRSLVERADRAMYAAKRSGKDAVLVYETSLEATP